MYPEYKQNTDRTRVTVDLEALRENYASIRKRFPGQKIISVIKADAYGHGISGIAGACDLLTDSFAVATVDEGICARKAGAKKPVLILGPVPSGKVVEAAEYGLSFSVGSFEYASELHNILKNTNLTAGIHVKLDTGFNRTGFRCREGNQKDTLEEILKVLSYTEFRAEGIYTHLPVPESNDADDREFTALQLERFRAICRELEKSGIRLPDRHVYSTGGAIAADNPEEFDCIRTGMMICGQCDTLSHRDELGLKPVLRWTSQLAEIRKIPVGESVGYGRLFKAERDSIIGIVPAGYADGYRRCYQGLDVIVKNKRVQVIGRICMDFMMLDLTDCPEAFKGDEVVLLGKSEDGTQEITAIEIAEKRDSTCGEVTAAISQRVPKYYVN